MLLDHYTLDSDTVLYLFQGDSPLHKNGELQTHRIQPWVTTSSRKPAWIVAAITMLDLRKPEHLQLAIDFWSRVYPENQEDNDNHNIIGVGIQKVTEILPDAVFHHVNTLCKIHPRSPWIFKLWLEVAMQHPESVEQLDSSVLEQMPITTIQTMHDSYDSYDNNVTLSSMPTLATWLQQQSNPAYKHLIVAIYEKCLARGFTVGYIDIDTIVDEWWKPIVADVELLPILDKALNAMTEAKKNVSSVELKTWASASFKKKNEPEHRKAAASAIQQYFLSDLEKKIRERLKKKKHWKFNDTKEIQELTGLPPDHELRRDAIQQIAQAIQETLKKEPHALRKLLPLLLETNEGILDRILLQATVSKNAVLKEVFDHSDTHLLVEKPLFKYLFPDALLVEAQLEMFYNEKDTAWLLNEMSAYAMERSRELSNYVPEESPSGMVQSMYKHYRRLQPKNSTNFEHSLSLHTKANVVALLGLELLYVCTTKNVHLSGQGEIPPVISSAFLLCNEYLMQRPAAQDELMHPDSTTDDVIRHCHEVLKHWFGPNALNPDIMSLYWNDREEGNLVEYLKSCYVQQHGLQTDANPQFDVASLF